MNKSFYKLLLPGKIFPLLPNITCIRKRSITQNETSVALRPFIFRVHPDLCSKYAVDKAKINEDSLKQLNEYIHKLQNNEEVKPMRLLFYLRRLSTSLELNEIPEMKTVYIALQSKNVVDAICSILKACKLPLDYLEKIGIIHHPSANINNNNNKRQKIKFEWTSTQSDRELWKIINRYESGFFYSKVGESYNRHHTETSINNWFELNLDKAWKNLKKVEPLRDDIARRKDALIQELGLTNIEWQRDWTLSTFNSTLMSLERVVEKNRGNFNLKGRNLIFGYDMGVSIDGDIVLPHDIISNSWIQILKTLSSYDDILKVIPHFEQELSDLLGGACILPPQQSLVLAIVYLDQLKKLINSVVDHKIKSRDKIKHDVSKLEISVECTTGPLMMTESGQIMVPTSCPAFLIYDYINKNAEKAINLHCEFIKTQVSDESIISLCQSVLKLKTLTQDSSITRQQMVSCCKRLLKLAEANCLKVDLSLAWVRIGQFYTVTPEGEMCIPWNFEDNI